MSTIQQLYLCEKPSQGKDIARILKCTQKGEGFLKNTQVTISWCFGHLLETASPEHYCDNLKPWRHEILPIEPEQWKMIVKESAKKQFNIIKKLLKETHTVVIATDADREGEVIAREILDICRFNGKVKRLWLSALDDDSIHKALNEIKEGHTTENLYQAGLGRQRADWLIGMNLTMAATVLFQAKEERGGGVLSVGRVQTPTLKLILDRDNEIDNFTSRKYFELIVQFTTDNQSCFYAKWRAREGLEDTEKTGKKEKSENRCYDAAFIQSIVLKIKNQLGIIEEFEESNKSQTAPLCFSLSQLQKIASSKFGFSAQKTLQIAQSLYETHKAVTYPRTDCGYLPLSQFGESPEILNGLKKIHQKNQEYLTLIESADTSFKSPVWNDKKITAHHGMIPTKNLQVVLDNMSLDEQKIYDLVCRYYLAQFLGNYEYAARRVLVNCKEEYFKTTSHTPLKEGWKRAFSNQKNNDEDNTPENKEDETKEDFGEIPLLKINETVQSAQEKITVQQTKPPPRFTEGTLIDAMKSIGKNLRQEEYKKILKETAGIGTEATRANIIETLFKREYIQAKGKQLFVTPKGKKIIAHLPGKMSDPVLTAELEQMLDAVATGESSLDSVLRRQRYFLAEILEELFTKHKDKLSKNNIVKEVKYYCESCKRLLVRKKNNQKGNYFWGCSGYPNCKFTAHDLKGKPVINASFQPD